MCDHALLGAFLPDQNTCALWQLIKKRMKKDRIRDNDTMCAVFYDDS